VADLDSDPDGGTDDGMDREQQALVREAFMAVLERSAADRVVSTLLRDGWDDIRAADEAFALGTLFEISGRFLSSAPILDLAVAGADGQLLRPILPLPGHTSAATVSGDALVIDGVCLADGAAIEFTVDTADGNTARIAAGELVVEATQGLDPQLPLCVVRGSVPASAALSASDRPAGLQTPILRRCLAHQLLGLADVVAEQVREHAITRTQFGRPLGTWQTVQHRLADIYVEIAAARAALAAAWRDPRPVVTDAAKLQAGVAALSAVTHGQQIFGAIGFTMEQGLNRFVRRTYVLEQLLGSRTQLAGEIADYLVSNPHWEPIDAAF
jgi:hypothetical protein